MRGSKRERRPGVWELRVHLGGGRYRSVTHRGGARSADRALAGLVAQVGGSDPSAATVADLVEQWLALVERDRSPVTLAEYRRLTSRHVLPHLGTRRVAALTTADVDRMYLDLGREGVPAATIVQVHRVLRAAAGVAVRWGWLPASPVAGASPPEHRRASIVAPTPEDVVRLVDEAESYRPGLGVAVRVAAAGGLRRGELLGLRWHRVDLEAGRLSVVETVVATSGRVLVRPPKSGMAREVLLDEGTVEVLARWRARCEAVAGEAGVRLARDGWVWSMEPDGSGWVRPSTFHGWWTVARDRAELPGVKLHHLRHAHVTWLLDAGVPVEVVAERVGHLSTATTRGYAHPVPGRDREAAAIAGRLLEG